MRDEEVKSIKKSFFITAAFNAISLLPTIVTVATFTVYVTTGHTLDGVKAFVTINYISSLRLPFVLLPMVISMMVNANVSLKRINKFLNNEELGEEMIKDEPSGTEAISLKDGSFHWGCDRTNVLEDIDIVVQKGSLTAVIMLL